MSPVRSRGRSYHGFHSTASSAPALLPVSPPRRPLSPNELPLAVTVRRKTPEFAWVYSQRACETNAVCAHAGALLHLMMSREEHRSQTVSIYSGGSPQWGHYPPCRMYLWNCCGEILYGSLKWSVWEVKNGRSGECVQLFAAWESPHPRHWCTCCVFTEFFLIAVVLVKNRGGNRHPPPDMIQYRDLGWRIRFKSRFLS